MIRLFFRIKFRLNFEHHNYFHFSIDNDNVLVYYTINTATQHYLHTYNII